MYEPGAWWSWWPMITWSMAFSLPPSYQQGHNKFSKYWFLKKRVSPFPALFFICHDRAGTMHTSTQVLFRSFASITHCECIVLKQYSFIYHIVLNKCSLRRDRHPSGFRGTREKYKGFLAIFAHFHLFWRPISSKRGCGLSGRAGECYR